jgi:hypothetical protein
VFSGSPDIREDGTVIEHSRVITWRRTVSESYRDDRSGVSSRTSRSSLKQAPASIAPSKTPSIASSRPSTITRRVTEPAPVPQVTTNVTTNVTATSSGDGVAKTILGTLLGAAAGAAVAYAMVKSERDSAQKEAEFEAFMKAKAQAAQAAQANVQPQPSMQDPQPDFAAPPRSVHRNIEDVQSQCSTPQERSVYAQRAIEPAPPSYHSPSYISAPPTQIPERAAIEYAPAYSVAPSQSSRSQLTATLHRSHTSPEMLALPEPRSTVSKARSSLSQVKSAAPSAAAPSSVSPSRAAPSIAPSAVYSTAPSTLISSFVFDREEGLGSEASVHSSDSRHSSKSRSKSHVSKHSSTSKHTSRSRAPSPPPEQPSVPSRVASKAASIVGSILGRDNASSASKKHDDDEFEIDDFNDTDTVAPSDSISQVSSSRRSHRSHRSHSSKSKHDDEPSKRSSGSTHSKGSKHSHHSSSKHSHHSRHSTREGSPLSQEWHETVSAVRPSVFSEPSDASTVKPIKPKSGRKDSATSEYDALFDRVQYGNGSVAALPVRGITPSMIDSRKNLNKSIMTYAMGQKLRPFEG